MTDRITSQLRWAVVAIAMMAAYGCAYAAEVTYRIVEYNTSTGEFTLAASGQVPHGAWAYWENDFGATRGNRYNQIPRNNKATLYLEGWQGCQIKSVTLSMCSNSKSGQVGLTVSDGDTPIYTERPSDFASAAWFGQWVSKDLHVYVDIHKPMTVSALTSDEASITLQGGTSEGSVYIDAFTIEYDAPDGTTLESPLGWIYERLTAKSTIADGDEVMLYRNGCAATDIDGMETSHYLDATPLSSTTDVPSHEVLRFCLKEADTQGQWTLTDQQGRRLCAKGKQALVWGDGTPTWTITLGYDGATIASTETKYGTLRYNAPAESYARFGLYTSGSLPLPFLYRKTSQRQPVTATSIDLGESSQTVALSQGYVVITPTLQPSTVTDRRIVWTSDHNDVATVNGGLVSLHAAGQATITASTHDGGAQATLLLTVTADATGISTPDADGQQTATAHKVVRGKHIVIIDRQGRLYSTGGRRLR